MAKKKSNKKKQSNKQQKISTNKAVNKKSGVKSKATSKKSVNSPKKARGSKKAAPKNIKKKAQQILSKQTWKSTRDSKGNIRKGRRKSLKLKTQGDKNRYQQIVKAISDYYKKAGTPLKRKDLYKEYRRVRDNYSNYPLSVLIPQFNRIVIQKKGTPQFPPSLTLGIPWYEFEDEMTAGYSQSFFKLKDEIILELGAVSPSIPNMRFTYSKIIGSYRKLYNNNIFRQWVKNQSPPAEFQYIKSRSKKGLYIFKISQPSIIPIQPPTPKPPTGTTTVGPTLPGPIGELLGFDEKSEYIKQITALRQTQSSFAEALKNKQMTYTQYRIEIENIQEEIDELQQKIKNL